MQQLALDIVLLLDLVQLVVPLQRLDLAALSGRRARRHVLPDLVDAERLLDGVLELLLRLLDGIAERKVVLRHVVEPLLE